MTAADRKCPLVPPVDWTTSARPSGNNLFHVYLEDASGKKIGAIWGGENKAEIADFIRDAINEKAQAMGFIPSLKR